MGELGRFEDSRKAVCIDIYDGVGGNVVNAKFIFPIRAANLFPGVQISSETCISHIARDDGPLSMLRRLVEAERDKLPVRA